MASPSTVGLVARMISFVFAILQAFQQFAHVQVFRADAIHRGDEPIEHVEQPAIISGVVQRHQVAYIGHHGDDFLIARGIVAHHAARAFGEVEAMFALAHLRARVEDGMREIAGLFRRDAQQMQRQALRGFRPDAGQAFERIDQAL